MEKYSDVHDETNDVWVDIDSEYTTEGFIVLGDDMKYLFKGTTLNQRK